MKVQLALLVLLSGCRFGGPTGSATALVEPTGDGGSEVSDEAGSDVLDDDPSMRDELEEDSSSPDQSIPVDQHDGGSGSDGGSLDGELCVPHTVPGCDPVSGQGCTQGINQCVVDRNATTPSGRCVFSPTQPSTGTCTEDDFQSTCPFLFSCIQGECRKYCYCDEDCDSGDSCSDSNERGAAAIFKLCVEHGHHRTDLVLLRSSNSGWSHGSGPLGQRVCRGCGSRDLLPRLLGRPALQVMLAVSFRRTLLAHAELCRAGAGPTLEGAVKAALAREADVVGDLLD